MWDTISPEGEGIATSSPGIKGNCYTLPIRERIRVKKPKTTS